VSSRISADFLQYARRMRIRSAVGTWFSCASQVGVVHCPHEVRSLQLRVLPAAPPSEDEAPARVRRDL